MSCMFKKNKHQLEKKEIIYSKNFLDLLILNPHIKKKKNGNKKINQNSHKK